MTNILRFSPSWYQRYPGILLWFRVWQLEGRSQRLMKGRRLDLKRHHAPSFQAVLQMTTDCGNKFIVHNEKSILCVMGRNTSIIQEREFLVKSSGVIISVHSQQVSFAKDLDKYSVLPAHSALKQGKLNFSILAHTTGI